jgi:hypothetical protein
VSGRNWSVPYRLGQHRVHKPLIYLAGNQHSNKFLCSEKRIYQHHKEALKNAEVLQRFDSSEKSRFCSKTALPKCLTINGWLFCKIAKARGFSAKSKSCNTSQPLTLRDSGYAHAVQELNKAIDRADRLLE